METWSTHTLFDEANTSLGVDLARHLRTYAQQLIAKNLAVIFTLGHLSRITGVDYLMLRNSVSRRRESANYRMYAVAKRSGGRRFIHSVCQELLRVQQFLNEEILQKCPTHAASYAFHASGGIRRCAAMHCRAKWLFQFDLTNFFYDVTEIDVFKIFKKLGYRPLLAFELARLCTTTRLPKNLSGLLKRTRDDVEMKAQRSEFAAPGKLFPYVDVGGKVGVLPQGAPTSPMLSNLAAFTLDGSLQQYALEHGFVYTRYADDITISSNSIGSAQNIGRIQREVILRIRSCGFRENRKKTHVAGPGSKKLVLGLLVDGDEPRLSNETRKRIDRHLHAAAKYGVEATAAHESFESAYGFYNHLSGLIAFVKDVDTGSWENFSERLNRIEPPWNNATALT